MMQRNNKFPPKSDHKKRPFPATNKAEELAAVRKPKPRKFVKQEEEEDPEHDAELVYPCRLNKYIAHAGVASRRKADELIKAGKVSVNGVVVREMGHKVEERDKVLFEGKPVTPERKVYILINKPKDYITTCNDEKSRKTVMDLIAGAFGRRNSKKQLRVYPVGRLDRQTTGVLLITNDGELAQKLTHPSKQIKKVYQVTLDKKLRVEDFQKIVMGGIVLEDGIVEVDSIDFPDKSNRAEVGIEIHSGKNRIVRRIFESLGYEIMKLDRVYFGGLTKKDLPRGRWRFLDEKEIIMLKHMKIGGK